MLADSAMFLYGQGKRSARVNAIQVLVDDVGIYYLALKNLVIAGADAKVWQTALDEFLEEITLEPGQAKTSSPRAIGFTTHLGWTAHDEPVYPVSQRTTNGKL